MMRRIILPPALEPGDVIGLVAPASSFPRDGFDKGVAWLQERGFRVRFRDDIFSRSHYLAGSAARRRAELEEFWTDPEIKAVICARGGYGTMHLLPDLPLEHLAAHPRIFLGYSDVTTILNLIVDRLGLVAFHGPLLAGFHKTRASSLEQMLSVLTCPETLPEPLTGPDVRTLRGGVARGVLCGGNLSLVAATLGTPFALETAGRILILEDVGERPYRLDRLLTQLRLAGKLEPLAGLAFGRLVDCGEPDGRGRPLEDLLEQCLEGLDFPVLLNLPFGHGAENDTLPLGLPAELDADAGTLRVLSPAVRPARSHPAV